MSRAIAQLINQPEQLVSNVLQKIENLNGNPSEDARLLAENIQRLRVKMQDLQLDPSDTTGEELYQALRAKFSGDCAQVDKAMGITTNSSLAERVSKATQLVSASEQIPQMWLPKHTAIKSILRQNPPKKLIKALNYRSSESFIKHEDVDAACLLASQLESKLWRSKITKATGRLGSADCEIRGLRAIVLKPRYWQAIPAMKSKIITDNITGTLAFWPANLPSDAGILPLALELINKVEKLSGQQLVGRVGELNPQLRWWSENSYLMSRQEDGSVSLNIKDLASDHLVGRDYHQRSTKHAAQALLRELVERYQNQSEKVSEALKDIGYNLSSDLSNTAQVPLGERLAAEYAQIE